MHTRPINAGTSSTKRSISVSIALQQGKNDAGFADPHEGAAAAEGTQAIWTVSNQSSGRLSRRIPGPRSMPEIIDPYGWPSRYGTLGFPAPARTVWHLAALAGRSQSSRRAPP
jgi:hypothetical protein